MILLALLAGCAQPRPQFEGGDVASPDVATDGDGVAAGCESSPGAGPYVFEGINVYVGDPCTCDNFEILCSDSGEIGCYPGGSPYFDYIKVGRFVTAASFPGAPCGPCADGIVTCREPYYGEYTYPCSWSGWCESVGSVAGVVCLGADPGNGCGGCAPPVLDGATVRVGGPCGACGVTECRGTDLFCNERLTSEGLAPGDACGVCLDGVVTCKDRTSRPSAICSGAAGLNACGSCDVLDALPGGVCEICGQLECVEGTLVCDGAECPGEEGRLEVGDGTLGSAGLRGALALADQTLVVGISAADGAGAVVVSEHGADGWQISQLLEPTVPADSGGYGVSATFCGARLFVAAERSDGGAVYVYERSDAGFELSARFVPPVRLIRARFGAAIACEADRVVVGAPGEDSTSTGDIWVFELDGATWTARPLRPVARPDSARRGARVWASGGQIAALHGPGDAASSLHLEVFTAGGSTRAWAPTGWARTPAVGEQAIDLTGLAPTGAWSTPTDLVIRTSESTRHVTRPASVVRTAGAAVAAASIDELRRGGLGVVRVYDVTTASVRLAVGDAAPETVVGELLAISPEWVAFSVRAADGYSAIALHAIPADTVAP